MALRAGFADVNYFNPFTWLIKLVLGKNYCHNYVYDSCSGDLWEATIFGVRRITKDKWLKSHKTVMEFEIPISAKREQCIINFMNSRIGAKYGFFQYPVIIFKSAYDNGMKQTICSEFVGRSYDVELQLVDKYLDKLKPNDLEYLIRKYYPGLKAICER